MKDVVNKSKYYNLSEDIMVFLLYITVKEKNHRKDGLMMEARNGN